MAVQTLYALEDLFIGQIFISRSASVDLDEVKAFASRFDPQPFHMDSDAAQTSFFGELVASGWHTAAITMRLLVDGGLPILGGLIGNGGELHWPRPTRPGDTLRVISEIKEIIPSQRYPQRVMVVVRCETRNQNDDIAQIFTPKLLLHKQT